MAIVDKTHSLTIEEALGKMGSGGGSFTEAVQTIPAVSGEYTVMSYGELDSNYGVRIENWCVLPEPSSIYGSETRNCLIDTDFEIKVTYIDGEGQENVDSVIVKFDTDTQQVLGTGPILSTSGNSMLYAEYAGEFNLLFGVIAVPQYAPSGGDYVRHDLFIKPRKAVGDTTAHVEVGAVQLIRPTKEFDIAYRIVNY